MAEVQTGAWCVYDEETNQWIPTNRSNGWTSLTDEEIEALDFKWWSSEFEAVAELVAAVETALREKNHG